MSRFLVLLLLSLVVSFAQNLTVTQTVRITTNLGTIDVQLFGNQTPATVKNFLAYMNKKAYDNMIFHRSVSKFIIQTGGFQATLPNLPAIAQDAAVKNEYSISNTRGTIAMAKLDGNPDSATNQFFFNLADNSSILNGQNGGFTVFGRIAPGDSASLSIMDRIAAVRVPSPGPLLSPYDQIPLQNYTDGNVVEANNLIVVKTIAEIQTLPSPAISDGGVLSAGAYGAYGVAAPGSYLEIYGSNLAETTRGWTSDDFNGVVAPTSLDGVTVTVGGQRAFVNFVSPSQVNVQVPSTVLVGIGLPVVLTYRGQLSGQTYIQINPRSGGLLAPPAFKVGGKQYVFAAHANGSLVTNGSIPGVSGTPARGGETIIFYGLGFGDVTPFTVPIAGRIVSALSTLNFPVQFKFGTSLAQVSFAGLSPGFVGLFQFNVIIPSGLPNGDVSLDLTQNNETIRQTLLIPVQN